MTSLLLCSFVLIFKFVIVLPLSFRTSSGNLGGGKVNQRRRVLSCDGCHHVKIYIETDLCVHVLIKM